MKDPGHHWLVPENCIRKDLIRALERLGILGVH
jgi:hypothetical protein